MKVITKTSAIYQLTIEFGLIYGFDEIVTFDTILNSYKVLSIQVLEQMLAFEYTILPDQSQN